MRNHRAIDALSGLVIAGAAVLLFLGTTPLPPRPDARLHEAIGSALAREVLALVKPGVGVAVLRRDTEAFAHPESDLQFRAFEKAFAAAGGRIASVQSLQVDPLRSLEVPPGDFFELIRRSPPGSGIVSFMGPPVLGPDQIARLGEVRPAVVAFCPGAIPDRVDLRALFEAGLLQSAVVERADNGTSASPVRTPGNPAAAAPGPGFDNRYRVIRRAEAANLPVPAP